METESMILPNLPKTSGDYEDDFLVKEELDASDDNVSYNCEENKPNEDVPFSLVLVDDDGNILEEYIKKEGELQPLVKPSDTSVVSQCRPKRPHKEKLKKPRKKPSGKRHKTDKNLEHLCYLCTVCDKEFQDRKHFRSHVRQHYTASKDMFCCKICDYTTRQLGHINRHIIETHCHFGNSNCHFRSFACTLCDGRFYSKKDLMRHGYVHTRSGPLKCSMCDFTHVQKDRLVNHIICHQYESLQGKHRKLKNQVNEKYECHHCGYKCDCKSRIEKHIYQHIGIHLFKCDKCEYKCIYKSDIAKHCTVHLDNKPFVCGTCSKTFKRKAHLLSHLSSKLSCQREIKRRNKLITKENCYSQ